MIYDALDESVALDRRVDVAIVGSGPAGITFARALGPHLDVLLIEAGGHHANAATDDSLSGAISGLHYSLDETRARRFGGSTALWAGYCALFDPIDFDARPWVAHSGWPLAASEVTTHYAAAAKLLHVDDALFDASALGETGAPFFSNDEAADSCASLWRFGEPKADFATENRQFLERAQSIDVLTNACVTEIIVTDDGNAVSRLHVRTLAGRCGSVRARCFLLAAGGIETPRLMLASRNQCVHGIGNAYGHVGRWFMEHPHVSIDGIEMAANTALAKWTGIAQHADGRHFTCCAGLRPDAQARLGVLNFRAHFYRSPAMTADAPPRVGLFFEQAPSAASRLTLMHETDALGLPRVRLNWNVCETDRRSHCLIGEMLAKRLLDNGTAVRTGPRGLSGEILYSNHQLGTTRMSVLARDGVVDENCGVHGIDNLYIAGGSVFPTVSWANPTMTVLALTLRLAQRLGREIAPHMAA
ncbi:MULTISPECIES: GMC family oxidoreductase [unclassified Caballeronia]|uniref:GMC family oxidoreductase n=1 Tax=unclassified Caballeronia TaxID=2646786 RepID=UPI002856E221|nr:MULTISPECIES: GMC family oxidoreductase [unclassified Caballeronia]MDR5752556.1 GMC family oxidoreductase [Caballeronia sp. LZ024]MDR5841712.1 GMC family oxidoreductase [Caballeronia sp. LZ031]